MARLAAPWISSSQSSSNSSRHCRRWSSSTYPTATSIRYPESWNSRSGSSTQSSWHHERHSRASERRTVVLPVPGGPCSRMSRPLMSSGTSVIRRPNASAARGA
ncbi:MAG: hypothetical protein AUI10_03375 [Actinobacteria bacterium 13_2_20CM_2_72_6]|nr:MAG: hypothetical protein AUI10_03375 [Actinobacteria bacterium 13_2_20CM_2_72_6]